MSVESAGTPTITLAGLKSRIAELQREINAGDGSEDYRRCVFNKYNKEREVRYTIKLDGEYYHYSTEHYLTSGSPAGSHVYSGPFAAEWLATHGDDPPSFYLKGEDWLGGRDAGLFNAGYPVTVTTARPLPEGKYSFYYDSMHRSYAICDAMPQEEKERHELFVIVTAPAGMLHEAFFDPVAAGAAFTADGSNGQLEPAAFTDANGAPATIQRIEWESQQVRMEFSPSVPLSGHHVDFIALDGSVALRLSTDDAAQAVDGDKTTLMWDVCSEPWSADEKLMLRISESGSDLTGATNDGECMSSRS